MTENDSQFVREVKELSNPEAPIKKAEDNREAIRYLAKQIAKLKKQRTTEIKQELIEPEEAEPEPETEPETEPEPEPEEDEEDSKTTTEDIEKLNLNSDRKDILKYLLDKEDWVKSGEIAENTSLSPQQIKNRYKLLKKDGLIKTKRSKGVKLAENLPEPPEKEEKDYECMFCQTKYHTGQGFASHLRYQHDIKRSDVGEEKKPTKVFNKLGKSQAEINRIKDSVGGVKVPESVEENFPKFEEGDRIDDPSHWSIDERKTLTKKILKEADKPLVRSEIAMRLYNLDEKPTFGEKHYNAVANYLQEMEKEGEVVEKNRLDVRGKPYGLPNTSKDSEDSKDSEEEVKPEKQEIDEEVEVIDAKHRLKQVLDEEGDASREYNSLKNTFTKLMYQDEKDEVTYYDFTGNYGGVQSNMDAWRRLFSNPTVLNSIRREVVPDKSFKWRKDGHGKSPDKWVIEANQ